ncbi:uncharacterized protein TRAVEDRAFT_21038 [Trametes versicolor FP-101664 SS1]|uniref:uncharacterized protein n=1 Tax=Trametes versicolor (strain FP-101664) TaxID=717944 RepID=UPI0004622622|nr:uncharacterized protein TRAVEDRAFT_21038 [Trametes versicolor FP-101664 SS1]EIW57428.1 hypothetical protein TRAVEDRAFT_21038 [Trametes versicolor FP-101664 SS1]
MLRQLHNKLDRTNIHSVQANFTAIIKEHIELFHREIGETLQQICPAPETLTEEEARLLIEHNKEVIDRAFEGTTLALALVNVHQRFIWAAGVGDSTVALSTIGPDGKRRAERLCDLHTFKNPKEYYRAVMAHSSYERPIVDSQDPIGDFALKLRSTYLTNLFRFIPCGHAFGLSRHASKIVTPPYIIAEPSVRFVDLEPVWSESSTLLVFTYGVDNLVDSYFVFTPEKHSGADPVNIVSSLLSGEVDHEAERALGHPIDPHWCGAENSRAVNILGNLLGGTDVERLEMVTDEERLRDIGADWQFHIDDTSIIVWGLT